MIWYGDIYTIYYTYYTYDVIHILEWISGFDQDWISGFDHSPFLYCAGSEMRWRVKCGDLMLDLKEVNLFKPCMVDESWQQSYVVNFLTWGACLNYFVVLKITWNRVAAMYSWWENDGKLAEALGERTKLSATTWWWEWWSYASHVTWRDHWLGDGLAFDLGHERTSMWQNSEESALFIM